MIKARNKRARVAYRTRRILVRVTTSPPAVHASEFDAFSHDLRTPLTALRAGLGLLEMRLHSRLAPDEEMLFKSVRESVERLSRILDDGMASDLLYSNNGKRLD